MKIAFILVNMFDGKHYDAMQPIVFAIISALSQDHEIHFYDERVKPLPESFEEEVIALSVDTFSAARAYRLADSLRSKHTIIMGGIHPSSVPEEAAEHADAVVIGEAEDTWPQVLEDLKQGALQPIYRSHHPALISFDPNHPALKGYLPLGLMETSRGCNHRCDFCSVKVLYPGPVRRKPLHQVKRELNASPDKLIFFVDDNLFSNRDYFISLTGLLRQSKKQWAAQVSLEMAKDEQLLRLAKSSGCVLLLIGFESLSDDSLSLMGKRQNRFADLGQVVDRIHHHGMLVYATFVFGYDSDTLDRVHQVVQFGIEKGISVVNFNPLQPMPSTPLYERLKAEGRLTMEQWWLEPRYRYGELVFEPKKMTATDLSEAIHQARLTFYSPKNSLVRWWKQGKPLKRLGLHLLLNHISRKEIIRKQARSFHETDTN